MKRSGIEGSRLIEYGKVVLFLRMIVTCTDNIIDDDSKGIVFLKDPKNAVVNNIFLIMTFQDLLNSNLKN